MISPCIMVPAVISAALKDYRERIQRELPGRLQKLVLFGSWARGEAHEDSDLDVLVVLARANARERASVIDLGAYVGLDAGLPVTPLVLTEEEWKDLTRRERGLPAEIEREGIDA
jgi:predicted nucleotidyltransferase